VIDAGCLVHRDVRGSRNVNGMIDNFSMLTKPPLFWTFTVNGIYENCHFGIVKSMRIFLGWLRTSALPVARDKNGLQNGMLTGDGVSVVAHVDVSINADGFRNRLSRASGCIVRFTIEFPPSYYALFPDLYRIFHEYCPVRAQAIAKHLVAI